MLSVCFEDRTHNIIFAHLYNSTSLNTDKSKNASESLIVKSGDFLVGCDGFCLVCFSPYKLLVDLLFSDLHISIVDGVYCGYLFYFII